MAITKLTLNTDNDVADVHQPLHPTAAVKPSLLLRPPRPHQVHPV